MGAGPAYNGGGVWETYTDEPFRESISGGPYGIRLPKSHYYEDFDKQKEKWMRDRETRDNDLVQSLNHLCAECGLNGGSVFDEVYFTNFMKDGEFKSEIGLPELPVNWRRSGDDKLYFDDVGTSLLPYGNDWPGTPSNRTAKNRKICNLASREFWLPILGLELHEISPDYIIPVGNPATHAIYRLFNEGEWWGSDEKQITSECASLYQDTVEDQRPSFLNEEADSAPTILPMVHWSRNSWNGSVDCSGDKSSAEFKPVTVLSNGANNM